MRKAITITIVLMIICACERNDDIYKQLTVELSKQVNIPGENGKHGSTVDFKLIYPNSWRQTITTDSSLTIDNNILDNIDGYNIITVMSHRSATQVQDRDLQHAFQSYLNENDHLDEKYEEYIKFQNNIIFVGITVNNEDIELLDSNILVTYSFIDPMQFERWITVHAQSYGSKRLVDQENMKKIVNSITWQ